MSLGIFAVINFFIGKPTHTHTHTLTLTHTHKGIYVSIGDWRHCCYYYFEETDL